MAAKLSTAKRPSGRNSLAEWAVNILVLLFASTSICWAYVVPTGSMEKTVLVGDHLIVDKLAYAPPGAVSRFLLPYEQPKHGDIIVFRYPADISQVYVKRVIGLPGDRIRIVNRQVYRNGQPISEPYIWRSRPYSDAFQDNYPPPYAMTDTMPDATRDALFRDMLEHHTINGEIVVPSDSYFAMGDHRDDSLDSRYWGFVPRENIIGKPVLIYWSYEAPEKELLSSSPKDILDHVLDLGEHFFTRTRWDRTFRLVRATPN